jgi:hypothetical protein
MSRSQSGQAGVPPILLRPSSISGRLGPGDDYRDGVSPAWHHHCDRNGYSSENPSHLPCSQSDIRLAAAVADDAGGLLHHLFTHHQQVMPEALTCWLVCSLLQLSSGFPLPGLAVSSSDLALEGRESGSSSGIKIPATVPLLARD